VDFVGSKKRDKTGDLIEKNGRKREFELKSGRKRRTILQ